MVVYHDLLPQLQPESLLDSYSQDTLSTIGVEDVGLGGRGHVPSKIRENNIFGQIMSLSKVIFHVTITSGSPVSARVLNLVNIS